MRWLEILKEEVRRSSIGRVAEALGFSRTTVSLVLSGKYIARTDNVAARILAVFGKIPCSFLDQEVSLDVCAQYYGGKAIPASDPHKVKHWQACQACRWPQRLRILVEEEGVVHACGRFDLSAAARKGLAVGSGPSMPIAQKPGAGPKKRGKG